jgi:hypothetical protein
MARQKVGNVQLESNTTHSLLKTENCDAGTESKEPEAKH